MLQQLTFITVGRFITVVATHYAVTQGGHFLYKCLISYVHDLRASVPLQCIALVYVALSSNELTYRANFELQLNLFLLQLLQKDTGDSAPTAGNQIYRDTRRILFVRYFLMSKQPVTTRDLY